MLTVDWNTFVITVPQSYLTPLGGVFYELDTDQFRLDLKAIEASADGMWATDTHTHNTEIVLSGVTYARFVEVIAPYTVEFEDGQYVVTAVGSNHNIADVKVTNQVSLITQNSAGLISVGKLAGDVASLKYQDASIWIDANNGTAGTEVGTNGTADNPVATLADAAALADSTGLRSFVITNGALTLDRAFTEWTFKGRDEAAIDLAGFSTNGSTFEGIAVSGAMVGSATVRGGSMEDVTGFAGVARECGISGTIALATGTATMHQCYSLVPGATAPAIDFVGAGRSVNLRAYAGGIQLENMVDASNVITVEHIAGQIVIDSSCTAGTAVLRGVHRVEDNSAGTTVDLDGSMYPQEIRELLATIVGLTA